MKNQNLKDIILEAEKIKKPIYVYFFEDIKVVTIAIGIKIVAIYEFSTLGNARKIAEHLGVEEYVRHRTMLSHLRVDGTKKGYKDAGKTINNETRNKSAIAKLKYKETLKNLNLQGE